MSVVAKSTKAYSGFAPTQIPGCALWLDAADTSSMTLSGSTVTQWRDKSGNGNHTSGSSGTTTYRTNGISTRGSLYFNSTYLTGGFASTFTGTEMSCFIVASVSSSSSQYSRLLSLGRPGVPDQDSASTCIPFVKNSGVAQIYAVNNNVGTTPNNVTYDTAFLSRTYFLSNLIANNVNGNTTFNTVSTTASFNITSYGLGISTSTADASRYTGEICEIVCYFGSSLSTSQAQQIEGYLAQKWGLASVMPASHPFGVSIAPSPQSFSPREIDGCALWLDAADPTTLTLSGSNVSAWRDKSGNSRHLTQSTLANCPAYTTDSGVPMLNFTGASSNFLSNTSMTIDYRTSYIFLVFKRRANNNNGLLSALINGRANGDWQNADEFIMTNLVEVASAGSGANDGQGANTNLTNYAFAINNNSLTTFRDFGTTSVISRSMGLTGIPNALYLGIRRDGATLNYPFDGLFGEAIIYNRLLSTSEYQLLQGYLAWKWGLIPNIPPSHPYKLGLPYVRQFSPRDIAACALWLDAADTSTFSLSGTTVTQWRDKSGSGNNGTPIVAGPTLVSNALNDMPGVTFPSAANLLLCGTILTGTNFSMIAVIKYSPTAGNQQRAVGQWKRYYNSGMQFTQGQAFLIQAGQSEQFTIGPTFGADTAATHIYSAALNSSTSSSTATLFAGVDGNTLTYTNSSGPNVDTAVTQFAVGGLYEGGSAYYPVKGYIHEVIVYKQTLSIAQLAQIEGYLAWKWNLTSNLPAAHPFEDKPPYAQPFLPTNVAGCSVWLDAADTGSVTLSGSSVTQWRDKSGNGKNASTSTNFPTYSTNSLNGKATIRFTGASGTANFLDIPAFDFGTSQRSIFFVIQNTGPSTGAGSAPHWFWPLTGNSTNALSLVGWTYVDVQAQSRLLSYTPAKNAYIIVSIQFGSTSGVGQVFTNGISEGTITKTVGGTSFANATSGYRLGWLTGSTAIEYSFDGNIAEMILFNTAVSTIQRQQVEGYLAWKWGLTSFLSVGHPFKYSAPSYYIPPFAPTDLAGCALWLDAADSTSLTLSGANVSAWRDKSPNSLALTLSGTPTWSSNSVNFTGTQYFTNSTISLNLSAMTVFLVGYTLSGSQNGGFMSFVPIPNGTDYNQPNAIAYTIDTFTAGTLATVFNYGVSSIVRTYTTPTNPFLFTHVQSGTAMTLYGLGTSFYTTTTNFTPGTTTGLTIGARYQNGNGVVSAYLTGNVKEIIVYNTALTTTQRQMVENYLAWKWGVNQSLVARPSVRPLPLYTRPINPLDIPVCTLWLDAADRSTLTLSGSNVTAWADKSGNGNTMSNTTGSNLPSFSNTGFNGNYPSVFFNSAVGTNLTNTSSSLFQSTAFDVYAVWKVSGEETSLLWYDLPDRIFILNGQGNNSLFGNPPFLVHWGSGGSGTWRFNGTNYIGTNPVLYNVSSTGSQMGAFLNGSANGSATVSYPGTTAPKQIYLYNPGFKWAQTNANMAEILVFSSVLSTSQRQQIEGYLAQKWGLSANIPTTHPFKRFPSLTTTFAPAQISGCDVWYDAADSNTVVLSGSAVTQWSDKSGNNKRLTAYSGPTYTTLLNGNRTITTNGSTSYLENSTYSLAQPFTVFVVCALRYSQNSSAYYVFEGTTGTGNAVIIYYPNVVMWAGGTNSFTNPTISYASTPRMYSAAFNGSSSSLGVNGATTTGLNPGTNSKTGLRFGRAWENSFQEGDWAEIIVYNSALSTTQRQQVEGYLAWKWGLVGSLPSTHPYKKFTP